MLPSLSVVGGENDLFIRRNEMQYKILQYNRTNLEK